MLSDLWFVRHGETEWSSAGRHTSTTEIMLTDAGCAAAQALAPALNRDFALVLASPRARARATAAFAGFPEPVIDDDLCEWHYGEFEGLTTSEIRERTGIADWTIWRGPVPGGESLEQVAARLQRVVDRCNAAGGDTLCFAHGHALRVFCALALGLEPSAGAHFALDPATINVVGSEHETRALRVWNLPVLEQ